MTAGSVSEVPPARRSLPARMFGAMRLDASVYEEVEEDGGALVQAGLVVLLAGLARGVGALPQEGWIGVAGSPAVGLVVWLVAATLIWGVGVQRFGYSSDYPELLRTLGFAAAPFVWLVVCVLPLGAVERAIQALVHAWAILALVVAVREALDVSNTRALTVCLMVLAITFGLLFLVGLLLVGTDLSE